MNNIKTILKIAMVLFAILFNQTANAQSEEAKKSFDEGTKYYENEEYDPAINSFTKAIKLYPKYALAYMWRGIANYNQAEFDKAINDYNEAIRLDPNDANSWVNRGDAYDEKGEYDKAINDYSEAIRLDPKNSTTWNNRALVYYKKGEYDKAINDYNEAIRLDPNDANLWSNRGDTYGEKGEYDKAIADYNEAIRLDPQNSTTWNNRALVYNKKGEYDIAIHDYNEAIRLDPKNSTTWNNRALVYDNKGEYDKAITDFNEAIRLEPNDLTLLNNRALVYNKKGEYDKAINDYIEAIRLDPKNSTTWNERGLVYKKTGEYGKAIADYNEAIRLDPKNPAPWNNRGVVYDEKGEYDKAIADYNEAIRLDPKKSISWSNRGYTYDKQGEYYKVINDYNEAIRLEPKEWNNYINIISPLVRTGQFDSAKKHFNLHKELTAGNIDFDGDQFWGAYNHYITAATENFPNGLYEVALEHLNIALKNWETKAKDEHKWLYIDILAFKGHVLEQLKRNSEAKDAYNQVLAVKSKQPDVIEALRRLEQKQVLVSQSDSEPPVIELIRPQANRGLNIVSANDITQIIGRAKDESGIAQIIINGQVIKAEEDGLFITSLQLKAGINEIVISATDKRGNKSSKTFSITGNIVAQQNNTAVEIVMPATEAAPQYHAILIASQDYTDASIPDLENPVKDATELKSILESNYTFDSKNIETLNNMSREEIMQAIVQKSNTLTENDNLIIFYAGHGIAEKDKFGDIDGYWIPSSGKKGQLASYISSDDLNKALKSSKSKHILVIADACFSGAFTRSLSSDASIGIQKQYSVRSRKIMASGNMEPVPDNSKFVYYLNKNLKDNKEKYLTAKKLFDSFYEAILNNSDTSPQYAAIKNVGDEGGEFVFIKK